jgi:hypothetical protein
LKVSGVLKGSDVFFVLISTMTMVTSSTSITRSRPRAPWEGLELLFAVLEAGQAQNRDSGFA